MKKHILFIITIVTITMSYAQNVDPLQKLDNYGQRKWVDSIMKNMTLEEKIGQLFMVQAYSNRNAKHKADIAQLIRKYHIGGLIFMQGTPEKQLPLNNYYQGITKYPLIIGFDGEWGLDMRLKNTYRFPWNMTLGAIEDNKLVEEFGKQLGEHCKRLGIHINFAPVVDVNINPKNPIIGNRSFGEDRDNVTNKAIAFTKGMQSQGVMACGKHFPGHGDTDVDSHLALPTIDFTKQRLDSIELYPYKELFDAGLGSVMTAHLSVPAYESNPDLPSSLSYNVVTNLLQKELGFGGLVITDGLNMKGAANFASPSDINVEAIKAGNDVLLIPHEIPQTVAKMKKAVKDSVITIERLNRSVKRILKAKYWAGLRNYKPLPVENLAQDLQTPKNEALHYKLVENSITLIKNDSSLLPIKNLANTKIAYVKLGDADNSTFVERLKDYTNVDVVSAEKADQIVKKLKPYDIVILGYHKSNANPWKDFKLKIQEAVWIQAIARQKKVILDVFASPYSLLDIKSFTNIDAVLVSYQNSKIAQDISAQMIFGGRQTRGVLPVSINDDFSAGSCLTTHELYRLSYDVPENVGMSSEKLKKVDSIAKVVIQKEMAPGLQVLVSRKGKVVYYKSFGYHTYKKRQKVKNTDIYDLASITKILGGTSSIMRAFEDGKFTLDTKLGDIFPVLKDTDKDTIKLIKALSHNSRLKAWIPYYKFTQDSVTGKPLKEYYRVKKTKGYNIKIANNLYLMDSYQDTINKMIALSPLREKEGYKYSGLLFYLFEHYMKHEYKMPFNKFVEQQFYNSLGATTLTYRPLEKFGKYRIVPTEADSYYRRQLLHGTVHDQGAAMMNGVSGNAGLFSNANDVAKMMQMFLQKGYYGGKRYFKPETVELFTKRHFEDEENRRGLGFDKPQVNKKEKATCDCVSEKSFGHSGYTGTYTWADPESELVFVFLSNRVHPTATNGKLVKQNIRTEVQRVVQEAIVE